MYREVNRRMQAEHVRALPRGCQVVYRALLDKAKRDHDGTWVAKFGDSALSSRTGYQPSSLRELRRQLEDQGLIVTFPGSGLATTRYEIQEVAGASA